MVSKKRVAASTLVGLTIQNQALFMCYGERDEDWEERVLNGNTRQYEKGGTYSENRNFPYFISTLTHACNSDSYDKEEGFISQLILRHYPPVMRVSPDNLG